jgi:hypothetical protein
MDFLHRSANNQPQTVRSNGGGQTSNVSGGDRPTKKPGIEVEPGWLRVVFVVLLFSVTVLAIAIASSFYVGNKKESNYVNKDRVQAVFLTNGQVYFGKISEVNAKYVDLQDIYYLNSQQQSTDAQSQTQPTSFSLVKLGCELHGPADQMLINRDQVSFWENLTTDGKVAKAIDQWKSENPNGQKCDDTTNSTQQSTGTTEETQSTDATKKQP